MEPHINIVIVSDHGMTYGSQPVPAHHPKNFPLDDYDIKKIPLGPALERVMDKVNMVVGSGAYSMVYPKHPRDTIQIAGNLARSLARSDVNVSKGLLYALTL